VKQTLPFEEELGRPSLVAINGSYLAVCTDTGQLKVFKIGGREARPFAGPSSLLPQDDASPAQQQDQQDEKAALSVASIRVNCTGQLVSGILARGDGEPDGRIAVFSSESNTVYTYDFGAEQRMPLVSGERVHAGVASGLGASHSRECTSQALNCVSELLQQQQHGALTCVWYPQKACAHWHS
jgi:hypothetical protein